MAEKQYQQKEIECGNCEFDFNESLDHFETLSEVTWGKKTKVVCTKCKTINIMTTDYFWLDGEDEYEYEQVIVE